jgi:hypothetical protein
MRLEMAMEKATGWHSEMVKHSGSAMVKETRLVKATVMDLAMAMEKAMGSHSAMVKETRLVKAMVMGWAMAMGMVKAMATG